MFPVMFVIRASIFSRKSQTILAKAFLFQLLWEDTELLQISVYTIKPYNKIIISQNEVVSPGEELYAVLW